MAQLKDLLVTGPSKFIGLVTFGVIPKYNNINLATVNDVTTAQNTLLGTSSDAAGSTTIHGVLNAAASASTAAATAQTRADNAYALAEDKTTYTEAKDYTDGQIKGLKDDLLGGAGEAYDTLKELADLISSGDKEINDALDALETTVIGKADKSELPNYALLAPPNPFRQVFDGEQHMVHTQYYPVMYDIASGIGCSLKNARSLSNQSIIGELILPYTTVNTGGNVATTNENDGDTKQNDPNICQVTANELGVYYINANAVNEGKITGKTLIGKFKSTGWNGPVVGNASSATILQPTDNLNTTTYAKGTWNANVPETDAGIVWRERFINSTLTGNSDSGDIVLWLQKDSNSSSILNMTIDGYLYQNLTKRVLDVDNISGTKNYIPKFDDTNKLRNSAIIDNGNSGINITTSLNVNSNITLNGHIIGNAHSSSWWNGRDNALLIQSTSAGYAPILSMKTTNGSWEMGHYNADGWHETLLLNYKNDDSYAKGNNENTVVHALKLSETGNLTLSGTTIKFASANFQYHTTDKCIDVIFN